MCDRRTVGLTIDGSFEAFLCVIHAFYYEKIMPAHIVDEALYQPTLGTAYLHIKTDPEKAAAVTEGIRKKISADCLQYLYCAFLNKDEQRYMDLFHYVVAGFKTGRAIDRYEQWQSVLNTHKYARNTLNEAHFFKEFIRFKKTVSGVFYARVEPENHVLPLIADHFASRMIDERFMIHDVRRRLAVVYDTAEWAIFDIPANAETVVTLAGDETDFQDLWITFFNAVAVEERISKKRQRNILPLRYRKNMTEFKR
ncbi:MAG: TIGR03915 family putative DNA repair protein [Clostridiales bacterium]|jgi:probable DNA metabolism protein|nr:TIGR03915 family putative DNA repair protein [Clostridiales bacterium]